jgi:hypothetical protein
VIWTSGAPAHRESALDAFRLAVLPRLADLPGFCSVSMLVDPESAGAVSSTVYDSRDAMVSATPIAVPLREEFTRSVGGEITEIAEFDLVLAHLRVPETV